jgi:hypothetical protein
LFTFAKVNKIQRTDEAIFFIFNFIDSAYDYGMQPA